MTNESPKFPAWKTPLPQLTAQEKRAFLASLKNPQDPSGEISLIVKLPVDILSPEGKKRWDGQKGAAFEQSEITTIKEDVLVEPNNVRHVIPKENVFETMDQKIMESRQIAKKIKSDFEMLQIPPPTEPIEVEPLFVDQHARAERTIPEPEQHTQTDFVAFKKNPAPSSVSRDRQKALKTIHAAESHLNITLQKSPQEQKKETPKSPRSRKINWDKVNEHVLHEDF
ncbi:hypothetical protein TVAG_253900 [Trichomonas vaginalis G3]|uniref:Uncharacterized protein n=1 Tax=Trichomonas vaginalis (strain ATCC PRA-98 / G3) TaxID=412133 RepID=A2DMQ7_TRIV3|nr:hypothetical protein TVAG_253900 [Trichomonas vaginalis G3]|eukprot:XP_001579264.1 hypothetical protein [Trichomonas vaginalis G3]